MKLFEKFTTELEPNQKPFPLCNLIVTTQSQLHPLNSLNPLNPINSMNPTRLIHYIKDPFKIIVKNWEKKYQLINNQLTIYPVESKNSLYVTFLFLIYPKYH